MLWVLKRIVSLADVLKCIRKICLIAIIDFKSFWYLKTLEKTLGKADFLLYNDGTKLEH